MKRLAFLVSITASKLVFNFTNKVHIHLKKRIFLFQPSFVIPTDSVPGRMGLLVTLFLCLLSLLNNITSKAPNTESITSITIWLIVCIFFVHCALLEYGCILVYKHLKLEWDPMADQKVKIKKIISRFDLICSIVSIVSFIVFNLFFWTLMM